MGFTVMPQSGSIIVSGTEDDDSRTSLFVFSLKDGKLNQTTKICSPCGHNIAEAHMLPLMINRREQLVVCCSGCDDIKLFNLQTGEWGTAFPGCKPRNLCHGGSNRIFIQSREEGLVHEFDCTTHAFKGPLLTLDTYGECADMCYVPPPVDKLFLSYGNKLVAMSFEGDKAIWGIRSADMTFHPELNVLFVVDEYNRNVRIVNPENGCLIQTLDLPDMGSPFALSLYDNQLFMLHNYAFDTKKISHFELFYHF